MLIKLMGLFHNNYQTNLNSDEATRFKQLAITYRGYAREAGIDLIAFRNEDLPLFTAQSVEEKRNTLEALQVSVSICEENRAQGFTMGNSPKLIWNSLKRFGLRPTSDLFSHITNDSIVEIYSPQGIQIFRSFNFYKFCSYSLEELYCKPWYLLYQRDEEITQLLMNALIQFFSGKWAEIVKFDIPPHIVKELLSPDRNEILVSVSHIAPLFDMDNSSTQAVLAIENAQFVTQSPVKKAPVSSPMQLFSVPPSLNMLEPR